MLSASRPLSIWASLSIQPGGRRWPLDHVPRSWVGSQHGSFSSMGMALMTLIPGRQSTCPWADLSSSANFPSIPSRYDLTAILYSTANLVDGFDNADEVRHPLESTGLQDSGSRGRITRC